MYIHISMIYLMQKVSHVLFELSHIVCLKSFIVAANIKGGHWTRYVSWNRLSGATIFQKALTHNLH